MRRRIAVAGTVLGGLLLVQSHVLAQSGASNASLPRFEVASVRSNTSSAPPTSRFPLGPGDAYVPGTVFTATNQPLVVYIRFAFGRNQAEQLRVPSWAYDERFDIDARAAGEPTKSDMRLMVRALLADRFKLAWHVEQREQPALELLMVRPGRLGPQLTRNQLGLQPCGPGAPGDHGATVDAIPCGSAGLVSSTNPAQSRISGRAEPIERLAALLSNNGFAGVDRVVLDRTGLTGTFDFTLEWTTAPDAARSSSLSLSTDTGPSISDALRQQLGLTLKPTRAAIDEPVIDHLERPSDN